MVVYTMSYRLATRAGIEPANARRVWGDRADLNCRREGHNLLCYHYTTITLFANTVRFTALVSDWSGAEAVNFCPCGAFSEIRTRCLVLTKNALCQMSYEGLFFKRPALSRLLFYACIPLASTVVAGLPAVHSPP